MTQQAAIAFIARVESDEAFALALEALKEDPNEVLAFIREAGFDIDPEEVRAAFLEHYGASLSEEQLAAIAGGLENDAIAAISLVGIGLVAVTAAGAAAAA